MSHSEPIRSDDANAAEQLQAKISKARQLQEAMKAANAIVRDRKLTDEEKVARITATCRLNVTSARELLKPDFAGRVGFAAYELTNNAANIRRMEERLRLLSREKGRESVTFEFPGGRVEDSADDCRVRIYHDQKPERDVIDKLKSHGFHWSPSLKCWSRLRNDSARAAVTHITGASWPTAVESVPAVRQSQGAPSISP
jgi:hypothetical protein